MKNCALSDTKVKYMGKWELLDLIRKLRELFHEVMSEAEV